MRCSSVAQISILAPGCLRRSSAAARCSFFLARAIGLAGRLWMARTRLLDRPTERHQCIPPTLVVHRLEPVKLSEPACDLRPRPHPAVVGRRQQPRLQRRQRLRCQNFRFGSIVRALIAKTVRSALVVAIDQNAHPARRERQQARHLVDTVATREQPQRNGNGSWRSPPTLSCSGARVPRSKGAI